MLNVHVHVRVKSEHIDGFIKATIENAEHSLQEPGVARFDVLQDNGDPAMFVLNEVYRTAEAPAAHRATAHYAKWSATVTDMMAEPRKREQFTNLFPTDEKF